MTEQRYLTELKDAAYQFRAVVRINVRSARERQLAVERIDEGLLWATQGVRLDFEQALDETPPSEQI
jgi:hypothetical protein